MEESKWRSATWLGKATLESVLEVNEQVLVLLRAQCLAGVGSRRLLGRSALCCWIWTARSLRRAAASAVLLVDVGIGGCRIVV